METQRAFLAIAISLVILFGYQYFFITPPPPQETVEQQGPQTSSPANMPIATVATPASPVGPPQNLGQQTRALDGRDVQVDTSLFHLTMSENGGTVKSFKLNGFRESIAKDSPRKELITTTSFPTLPLLFNWGNGPAQSIQVFSADREQFSTTVHGSGQVTMTSNGPDLGISRTMTFVDDSYLMGLDIVVTNNSGTTLQGAPHLDLINQPFTAGADNSYLFTGPSVYLNEEVQQVKVKDLNEGPKAFTGAFSWAAYEDTYFMCGIIPPESPANTVTFSLTGEETVATTVAGPAATLAPGASQTYHYGIYFGPKKLKTLKETGYNLEKAVNFGYFDIIAKPVLYLMNFFHAYLHNYGVAIILVTIIFKLIFWPISHKGMKSMKTMQKIQPKMTKLREKYKDDKERLNQEMMTLYKTYKVNPLGGCLPMLLQIPVFFALYKVLLQTIELRHAPFMLWITDLSAPDRLFIGVDLPYLGGIPVLTLLMGASMFLQQKMTPSSGDPTQAKVMMFLPIIFTFMFLNFASGLVLYWFVNNLLSMSQQYFINRSVD